MKATNVELFRRFYKSKRNFYKYKKGTKATNVEYFDAFIKEIFISVEYISHESDERRIFRRFYKVIKYKGG